MRTSTNEDIPSLRALWNECFPEDRQFEDFFFSRIFKAECATVYEEDGAIRGMLHAFPITLHASGDVLDGRYIYGVGTAKAYRGRKIAAKLLSGIKNDCDLFVLIPQEESLFKFYARHGYEPLFSIARSEVYPQKGVFLKNAGTDDIPLLNEMYEREMSGYIHIGRDDARWRNIIEEMRAANGGIALYDGGYCVYYRDGTSVVISELIGGDAANIAGAFGKACTVTEPGEGVPFACARLLTDKARKIFEKNDKRYFNLMDN